jgi:hypothetical protein
LSNTVANFFGWAGLLAAFAAGFLVLETVLRIVTNRLAGRRTPRTVERN